MQGLAGDDHHYFAGIRSQLGHADSAIDATNEALSGLLDLGLNRTTFLLTIVATVFLPLTFITGFFGQNFDWFLSNITSAASFWVLGIGLILGSILSSLWAIRRQLGPRESPDRSSRH